MLAARSVLQGPVAFSTTGSVGAPAAAVPTGPLFAQQAPTRFVLSARAPSVGERTVSAAPGSVVQHSARFCGRPLTSRRGLGTAPLLQEPSALHPLSGAQVGTQMFSLATPTVSPSCAPKQVPQHTAHDWGAARFIP